MNSKNVANGVVKGRVYKAFRDKDGWIAFLVRNPSLSAGGDTLQHAVTELSVVLDLVNQTHQKKAKVSNHHIKVRHLDANSRH